MTVKLRKVLQYLALAVIAFFLGRVLYGNWEEVRTYQWSFDYSLLALSLGGMLASLCLYAWQWRFSLQRLGAAVGFIKVLRIYFIGNLGRYIPGKVWQFLGWFYLFEREGVNPVQTLTSIAVNQVVQNITGLALAFVVLAGLRSTELSGWLLPFLIVIPLGLVVIQPSVLEKLLNWGLRLFKRGPVVIELTAWDLARFAALHLLIWLSYGLAFYIFTRALYPVPLEWLSAWAGIFAGAWTLGFLSFLAPGGLGVREGILVYLLGFYLPSHVAIVVTLLSRLWVTAAELMGTALAFGFDGLKGALPWGYGRVSVEGKEQGVGPNGLG
jgi:uncharacterized membrane protein YbhN (UPF0104 family)